MQTVRTPETAPEGPVRSLIGSIQSSVVVVGSALVVLAACGNSITWHLQQFWGTSGNLWQSIWDRVYDYFEGDQFNIILYGTPALGLAVFWSAGIVYILMDVTLRPETLRRYKIQPGTNEPVDTYRLLQAIFWVLFNQTVVGLPCMLVFYKLLELRGFDTGRELPTFHWVLLEIAVCLLVEEVAFYYSHRLLHSPRLYKKIHKWHHEWTSPISITALYAHPLEHVLSNYLPPFLGVLLLGSHVATAWLWFSMALLSTINAHSGYHLPFFPSPEAHDFHHLKFNQCYGVLGVLDRLHGTDDKFRRRPEYQRHVMQLSLVPLRQMYPDQQKGAKAE
ncbi:fatty acid hydroxylase domain-containing protein 2-like isoform X1 [Amphibalanus amphitrite]|uniref:fatty acid hydroxylase domain-containing protein 2-like n=1 Tax=Amphibalanus amphitrite TaxID=1232801 RepID=UPI001C91E9E6|nr:fatty acid hydroxylase domain-containing protein 2-like [Amphibalanus amphitrite]XP_043218287.1 fatty acid hydroxylase domain-containing protein 2-like [Amphibalanus amphitrite]XP_043218288.1 fatty acid hydroxylase domain-containing protein 2-like [Amphibalanus amphitrite]XP_043227293.1 fatty acid hydroxylase domain-containing protein 2-like isoform X1 [Amphibalanus amphitrite]XP_043227294.1 fatty acid hydroxylase domain-containing protein 2-like isoform X1 [Amphibalanus amphitrite]XP_04322